MEWSECSQQVQKEQHHQLCLLNTNSILQLPKFQHRLATLKLKTSWVRVPCKFLVNMFWISKWIGFICEHYIWLWCAIQYYRYLVTCSSMQKIGFSALDVCRRFFMFHMWGTFPMRRSSKPCYVTWCFHCRSRASAPLIMFPFVDRHRSAVRQGGKSDITFAKQTRGSKWSNRC